MLVGIGGSVRNIGRIDRRLKDLSGIITDLEIAIKGDAVAIKTFSNHDAGLEIYDTMKHLDAFKAFFKKQLQITP